MDKDRFLINYLVENEFYPWICHYVNQHSPPFYLTRVCFKFLPLIINSVDCSNFKASQKQRLYKLNKSSLTPYFSFTRLLGIP